MSKFPLPVLFFLILAPLLQGCSKFTKSAAFAPTEPPAATKVVSQPIKSEPVTSLHSAEKQVLIRLVRELEELDTLIEEAQFKSSPDARTKFDYLQLKADLLLVTQGIHAHIRISDFTPRTLKPIIGQYAR